MAEIIFKPKKQNKNVLRKKLLDIEVAEENPSETIETLKEFQSLRKKSRGLCIQSSNVEEEVEKIKNLEDSEFSKVKVGGLVTISSDFTKNQNQDEFELDIGTAFSKETNRKDDYSEMMNYIEEELDKRKQKTKKEEEEKKESTKITLHPNDAFYYLSDHLVKSYNKKNRSEEMMSNQMLSGIPEVNLGIETKIANIEATELEKQKVVENKRNSNSKAKTSSFVPTNIAVNYVQHNRFNIESDKSFYMSKDLSSSNYEKASPPHPSSANKNYNNEASQKTPQVSEPTVRIEADFFADSQLQAVKDNMHIKNSVSLEKSSDHENQSLNNDNLIDELESLQQKPPKKIIKNNTKNENSSSSSKPYEQSNKKSSTNNFTASNKSKETTDTKKRVNPDKATDDFYFEKYRKQFSRY